jgi:peptidoglycan/xylan/chitin deacetylase (PgdA/CDA1 family)
VASDTTQILMLHRVLADTPAAFGLPGCYRMRGTALTPDEFRQVLDKVGPIVTLAAVEQALTLGEEPPTGSVLTFDDGYREHLDLVAPMLADRCHAATFYVATGLHGEGTEVAVVDAWYWLLDHAEEPFARVPMPDGGAFHGRVDTFEGKLAWVAGEPKAALLASTSEQQEAMLAALSDSVGCALPVGLAAAQYLRRDEWSALVSFGMRIGAHSVRHPRLTQVDDATLRNEVATSVASLGVFGPVAFAYPDGAYDERVEAVVRKAGVSSAVTCDPGVVTRGVNLQRLPRRFVLPGSRSAV